MKIAIIIPYYGKFPNYFSLWLYSAGYNSEIDFLIFTDIEYKEKCPENVKMIHMTFENLVYKIKEIFDERIVLSEPYKLCDYRPAYGEIFQEFLGEYDFWGHCDLDLILGNVKKFISDEILKEYDRILTRGHLCLYRNTEEINCLYREISNKGEPNYNEVYHTRYSAHFDEGNMIKENFKLHGKKVYDEICFADISYRKKQFELAQEMPGQKAAQIFKWTNGKLFRYYIKDNEVLSEELAYLHLQKRQMQIQIKNWKNDFLIVPNSFIVASEINSNLIKIYNTPSIKYNMQQRIKRSRNIIVNIINGALKFRYKKIRFNSHNI